MQSKTHNSNKNGSQIVFALSQAGFSLLEVVISLGLLGLISGLFATSILSVMSGQKSVELKNDLLSFKSAFSDFFIQPNNCNSALIGKAIPTVPGQKSNLTITNFVGPLAGGSTTLQNGTIITGSVANPILRVNSITIESKDGAPTSTVRHNNINYVRSVAVVELITEQKQNSTGTFVVNTPVRLELPVLVDNLNVIAKCTADLTQEDICQLIGSTLDSVTGNCIPASVCQIKGAYVISTCTPAYAGCYAGAVNPITAGFGCPVDAVSSKTGEFSQSFIVSCGKKCSKSITNTVEFYLCTACP